MLRFEVNEVLRKEDLDAALKWSTNWKKQAHGTAKRVGGGILTLLCGSGLIKLIVTLLQKEYQSPMPGYTALSLFYLVLFLLLGLLFLTNGRILVPWMTKKAWKNNKYKGQPAKLVFDEAGFHNRGATGGSDYRYCAVSEWTEDQERYMIALAAAEVLILRKDSFTQGGAAAFGGWLEERLGRSDAGEPVYQEEGEAAFQLRMVYTQADFMALNYAVSHPRIENKKGKRFLRKGKRLSVWQLILCLTFGAVMTLQLFAKNAPPIFAIAVGIIFVLFTWFFSTRWNSGGKGETMWRQYRDKGSEVAYWFSKEYFTWQNKVGLHHLFYDQLEGIGEDGNHFFLFVNGQKAVHILRKDGFTKGAASDFALWVEEMTRERKNVINQQGQNNDEVQSV